jgi:hypothetical protein
MAVQIPVRLRSLATLGLFAFAGCAYHSYGLTVSPAPGFYEPAWKYLGAHGYAAAPNRVKGESFRMERWRADSVDQVRIFSGGGSPGSMSFYDLVGSGSGAYPAGYNRGVYQGGAYTSSGGYSAPGGPSGMVTLELTTYRVDARGVRHAVEPTDATLDELDSLITLVERVPPPKH